MIKEFLINLIPARIKWKKSVSGTGEMYKEILNSLVEKYGNSAVKDLSEVMYKIGFEQGKEIQEKIKVKDNLYGCALVLLTMHRIFGIKSKIVEKSDKKVVIHISYCQWKDKEGWNPKCCMSLASYERGLVENINSNIIHRYTKTRSLGNEFCEIVLEEVKSCKIR